MKMKLRDVKIGEYTAKGGLFLAPMAGFTDIAFRKLCREYGATYGVSEMVSAAAVHFKDRKTGSLARLPEDDTPTSVQIFGHSPEIMAEAAYRLATGDYAGCETKRLPAAIDINMGCPVRKIVTSGDGSVLMKTPKLCAEITKAVSTALSNTNIPVTVKMRLGFTADTQNAPEIARMCAEAGAAAIFVHGRTREMMYSGSVMAEGIARVREAVPPHIPVIANGDVTSRESAEYLLRQTGCDGIMIGRGALSSPWIFSQITEENFVLPDENEKKAVALHLIEETVKLYGESAGVPMSRCRAGHILSGIRGAASMRRELNTASTLDEVMQIFARTDTWEDSL